MRNFWSNNEKKIIEFIYETYINTLTTVIFINKKMGIENHNRNEKDVWTIFDKVYHKKKFYHSFLNIFYILHFNIVIFALSLYG